MPFFAIRGYEGRYAFDNIKNQVISLSQKFYGRPVKPAANGYIPLWDGKRTHSFYLGQLKNMCGIAIDVPHVPAPAAAVSRNAILSSLMKPQHFIIGSISNPGTAAESFSFAPNQKIHTDEQAAIKECERLAASQPGKTFVYFQKVKTVRVSGVEWK